MRGPIDRPDDFTFRDALLIGLWGGCSGVFVCVVVLAWCIVSGLIPLDPIAFKLLIILAVFVFSFLATLSLALQHSYWM